MKQSKQSVPSVGWIQKLSSLLGNPLQDTVKDFGLRLEEKRLSALTDAILTTIVDKLFDAGLIKDLSDASSSVSSAIHAVPVSSNTNSSSTEIDEAELTMNHYSDEDDELVSAQGKRSRAHTPEHMETGSHGFARRSQSPGTVSTGFNMRCSRYFPVLGRMLSRANPQSSLHGLVDRWKEISMNDKNPFKEWLAEIQQANVRFPTDQQVVFDQLRALFPRGAKAESKSISPAGRLLAGSKSCPSIASTDLHNRTAKTVKRPAISDDDSEEEDEGSDDDSSAVSTPVKPRQLSVPAAPPKASPGAVPGKKIASRPAPKVAAKAKKASGRGAQQSVPKVANKVRPPTKKQKRKMEDEEWEMYLFQLLTWEETHNSFDVPSNAVITLDGVVFRLGEWLAKQRLLLNEYFTYDTEKYERLTDLMERGLWTAEDAGAASSSNARAPTPTAAVAAERASPATTRPAPARSSTPPPPKPVSKPTRAQAHGDRQTTADSHRKPESSALVVPQLKETVVAPPPPPPAPTPTPSSAVARSSIGSSSSETSSTSSSSSDFASSKPAILRDVQIEEHLRPAPIPADVPMSVPPPQPPVPSVQPKPVPVGSATMFASSSAGYGQGVHKARKIVFRHPYAPSQRASLSNGSAEDDSSSDEEEAEASEMTSAGSNDKVDRGFATTSMPLLTVEQMKAATSRLLDSITADSSTSSSSQHATVPSASNTPPAVNEDAWIDTRMPPLPAACLDATAADKAANRPLVKARKSSSIGSDSSEEDGEVTEKVAPVKPSSVVATGRPTAKNEHNNGGAGSYQLWSENFMKEGQFVVYRFTSSSGEKGLHIGRVVGEGTAAGRKEWEVQAMRPQDDSSAAAFQDRTFVLKPEIRTTITFNDIVATGIGFNQGRLEGQSKARVKGLLDSL